MARGCSRYADENGWNTVWNGPCGGRIKASYIAPGVDYATFSGFRNYIDAHSPPNGPSPVSRPMQNRP